MNTLKHSHLSFKKGLISPKAFKNRILEHVFLSKVPWGLGKMDEDDFSEFLISLKGKLDRIIANYNPDLSDFTTYLSNAVRAQASWWSQKKSDKRAVYACCETLVNEEADTVAEDEKIGGAGCDPSPDAERAVERLAALIEKSSPKGASGQRVASSRRYLEEVKDLLWVLSLKACNDMSDPLARRIISVLGCSEEEFYEKQRQARESMAKKTERALLYQTRRNRAYLARRQAMLRLKNFQRGDSDAERDAELYKAYDKRWRESNEKVSSQKMKPSNLAVGRILRMSPRRVTKLLVSVSDDKKGGEKDSGMIVEERE